MMRDIERRDSVEIGLFTDGLMHLPFAAVLETAARLGVQAVEIGTGNFSPASHCDLDHLLRGANARAEFLDIIRRHELRLAALNCSGNPLHPNQKVSKRRSSWLECWEWSAWFV
ncbi:MAG: hypothetical protein ACR2IV_13115 [Bryobacteraceae bacterium]